MILTSKLPFLEFLSAMLVAVTRLPRVLAKVLVGLMIVGMAAGVVPSLAVAQGGYQTPTDPNLLFFIQNSSSANTVVYTAKLQADGTLDSDSPIAVFWRRFNTDGHKKKLSYLERTQVYGVRVEPSANAKGEFVATLVSYSKRSATLKIVGGRPQLEAVVAGRKARLVSAFLDVEERKPIPRIKRVQVRAVALDTGEPLTEIIDP